MRKDLGDDGRPHDLDDNDLETCVSLKLEFNETQ